MHTLEVVVVRLEPHLEKFQTLHEEIMVVVSLKHRIVNIAHQVLEERTDNNIHNLTNFQVNIFSKCSCGMVLFKFLTTCYVLLRSCQIKLIQSFVCILIRVNRVSKIETDVIHQKPKNFNTSLPLLTILVSS